MLNMETKNKIIFFTGVSVLTHAVVFMLFSNLLIHETQLTVSPFNNYQSLQVSLNITPESTASNSALDAEQNETLPEKLLVAEKTPVKALSIEPLLQAENTVRNNPADTANKETMPTPLEQGESLIVETSIIRKSNENSEPTLQQQVLTHTDSANSRNMMIREKLNAMVKENFTYPKFAIKRGWQGTVKLGLRIEANGTLSNVHIVKTSGYSILDQAALSTLSRTEHISGIESWLAGNYLDTTLPVIYQLIDG